MVFEVQAERPRPKRAKHGHNTTARKLPQAREFNGGWWFKLPRPPLHDLHIRKCESETIPENSTRHSSRAYVASNDQPSQPGPFVLFPTLRKIPSGLPRISELKLRSPTESPKFGNRTQPRSQDRRPTGVDNGDGENGGEIAVT